MTDQLILSIITSFDDTKTKKVASFTPSSYGITMDLAVVIVYTCKHFVIILQKNNKYIWHWMDEL
ncbi:hypothetical protein [Moraxella bovoculi]|uniref:hypothetical protein n=1 Tax=Moraxella bovoculi TaxID=386891 RepID=UPI000AA8EE21|nr:hypothetical protein [Moraxella bovoculi]